MNCSTTHPPWIGNVAGGLKNSFSLSQLNLWCEHRIGPHPVYREPHDRPYDAPWIVLDTTRAHNVWQRSATTLLEAIVDEIATHAEKNPQWLDWSGDP
jgi:CDP-paratose 2-epimerase